MDECFWLAAEWALCQRHESVEWRSAMLQRLGDVHAAFHPLHVVPEAP